VGNHLGGVKVISDADGGSSPQGQPDKVGLTLPGYALSQDETGMMNSNWDNGGICGF
jgi:hypothetical protein